ncbi:MAG: large subunit ribosomal protein [Methanolobus sp.]|jgi:large subunit ribosomal protein L22|uniref:Large ribosomal subunit protein uL22 n=1 Tax=Methanolobus tindarius DSM 2278 TaxID=1090322 RepID=W9DZ62_METTI|nr:50S ribosomal protein L22 [Methanolobus tindarius]ETA68661.1 ribosomal protein L22/L17 [Methanolobus tindarius DSM 2278]MDK2940170.1 large subunit ribosomal protein [Methanolobus sp.]
MARIGYSIEMDSAVSSKAMGSELHISPKKSRELCKAIKGMRTSVAQKYLEDVVIMKQAVPFKRHCDGSGHRKGPMANGRYPVKVAEAFLKILENARSNAEYKGLDPEHMYIAHAAAKRGRVIHGMRPRARGRGSPSNTETVNVEIILNEVR